MMSGKNESLFDLPPGLNRTTSQYAAGQTWWKGNLIRWFNRMLTPIGGWVKTSQIPTATPPSSEPIRATHSWRDLLKAPWAAYGSANKLWGVKVNDDGTFTYYDITPSSMGYNPGGGVGYGSGLYGKGVYGISSSGGIVLDSVGLWSLSNFGKLLVGVASQDGRLVKWDPVTPSTIASVITEAPIDNTLVVVTDEEFLMVLGGKNNPRRVKWASRRTYTDWIATDTNSAGGFDIQSNGVIIAACVVPGGVLILTDTDAHIAEYVGAPYYYGRRRLSTECDVAGPNVLIPTSFGAIWMGTSAFWQYNGAVNNLASSVELDVFFQSNLSQPHLLHSGINQFAQEAWWFYPDESSPVPNKYVVYGYNKSAGNYWTLGEMTRTAWLNPVWQAKPLGINDQNVYLQETGDTADGALRNAYAETGAMELSNGDTNLRVDRVYSDIVANNDIAIPATNISMTFSLRQAPEAPLRTYGPVSTNAAKGYVAVRMRARQISVRFDETSPGPWSLGKMRMRIKQAGVR